MPRKGILFLLQQVGAEKSCIFKNDGSIGTWWASIGSGYFPRSGDHPRGIAAWEIHTRWDGFGAFPICQDSGRSGAFLCAERLSDRWDITQEDKWHRDIFYPRTF